MRFSPTLQTCSFFTEPQREHWVNFFKGLEIKSLPCFFLDFCASRELRKCTLCPFYLNKDKLIHISEGTPSYFSNDPYIFFYFRVVQVFSSHSPPTIQSLSLPFIQWSTTTRQQVENFWTDKKQTHGWSLTLDFPSSSSFLRYSFAYFR